tara:strand:- start:369 stop:554 length:186 start_codon:yes stop_codon:yes gene_type:complete
MLEKKPKPKSTKRRERDKKEEKLSQKNKKGDEKFEGEARPRHLKEEHITSISGGETKLPHF